MRAGVAVQDITSTIRRVPSVRSRISLWEGFFSSAYHKSFHATTSLWQRIFPRSSIVVVCFIAPSAAAPISTRSTILPIAHRKLHRNTEPPAWWRWAVLRPHHHHGFSPSCWGQHLHPWRQCGLVATGSSWRNRRRWRRRPRWQRQVARTTEEIQQRRLHHLFAQNATEWLDVRDFATSEDCVADVRKRGYQLWVTDLSQEAEALEMPAGAAVGGPPSTASPLVPPRVALVMGTEAVGASQYILGQADKRVYLPLRGFADSLNLSVATALILHHLFCMDPTLVGAMADEERTRLRQIWYTKLCQQRILTSAQKKARTRLVSNIKKCHGIYERRQKDPSRPLQPSEQRKLDDWPTYKQELDALEALVDPARVALAVQEWVENPPEPLTDLRRSDVHRVCYVGKNTKQMHKDHWKDMVATSNAGSLHGATATAMRDRLNQVRSTTAATTAPTVAENKDSMESNDP